MSQVQLLGVWVAGSLAGRQQQDHHSFSPASGMVACQGHFLSCSFDPDLISNAHTDIFPFGRTNNALLSLLYCKHIVAGLCAGLEIIILLQL
jgi:hypothetical protein